MASMPHVQGLEDYWASQIGNGSARGEMADRLLLDTLGLGNQQVLEKLHAERPGFEAFREWILATAGPPDPALLDRYHGWLNAQPSPGNDARPALIEAIPPVLDSDALAHWDEHGYVVLPDAITREQEAAVADLLWTVIGASPGDRESWYGAKTDGMMVPYFQHRALEAARRSPRVHKAFAQLWGTTNLWVTIDRMGFNPPERPGHQFNGSGLHWDASLVAPIPFGTQGVLYLTDTAEDQGAFRCVPGFHRRIDGWLAELGDADPRGVDLSAEAEHVPGRAGDLIIWRQDLPHGASPNRSTQPRLTQYLNYYSPDMVIQPGWR